LNLGMHKAYLGLRRTLSVANEPRTQTQLNKNLSAPFELPKLDLAPSWVWLGRAAQEWPTTAKDYRAVGFSCVDLRRVVCLFRLLNKDNEWLLRWSRVCWKLVDSIKLKRHTLAQRESRVLTRATHTCTHFCSRCFV
jgi:hypothetical protein